MTKRSTIGLFVIIAILFVIGLLVYRKLPKKDIDVVNYNNSAIVNAALKDSSSAYYVNFASIDKDIHLLPIAIIASDTTQFSMLNTLNNMDFFDNITGGFKPDGIVDYAGERFIFFADMANRPYSDITDGNTLRNITVRNAISLLQDKATLPKIFIINDPIAAIWSDAELTSMLKQSKSGIQVISVVRSAINHALDNIDPTSSEPCAIGIIASEQIISSNGFQDAIREEILNRGLNSDIQIIPQVYSADTVNLRYFVSEEESETKQNVNVTAIDSVFMKRNVYVTAIDSVFMKRKIKDDGESVEMKAIIVANNEYYQVTQAYAEQVQMPCPLIMPEQCAAIDCYRTLRLNSNLSLRITKKSQQIYFSVRDDDGTTQNVCINQL